MGMQTEAMVFPVVVEDPAEAFGDLDSEKAFEGKKAPEGYLPAKNPDQDRYEWDFRKKKGLECLFLPGTFLKDKDADLLPDDLDLTFVIGEDAEESVWKAAADLAFRFGMETTGFEGTLLSSEDVEGNQLVFDGGKEASIFLEEKEEKTILHITGEGEELEKFISAVCNRFPKTDAFGTWQDQMIFMTDDLVMKAPLGQAAYLKVCKEKTGKALELYGSPEMPEKVKEAFKEDTFYNYKAGKKAYEKNYQYPWEADVLVDLIKEKVLSKIKPGDAVSYEAAVSEDKVVRAKLVNCINDMITNCQGIPYKSQLLCAYKQGFSWIDETIIPAVKDQKIDKMEIYFKPFLPEGETEWVDEDGATPSYHNVNMNDTERWLDMPIRYLQELYPIEDVIIKALDMEREQVVFLPYEGEEYLTYICRCYSGEKKVLEESYLASWSERPYLDEFAYCGKVHPSTGYVKVWINQELVLDEKIKTDLEQVWATYQAEVLPDLCAYLEEKFGGTLTESMQPFFQQLLMDITISEPDELLDSREDMISSLDALQEDMYFAGQDFFKNYGKEKAGCMLDAPGLIFPDIHKKEGAPVFNVTLFETLYSGASIKDGDEVLASAGTRDDVDVYLPKLSYEDGKLVVTVMVERASREILKAYAQVLESFNQELELGRAGGCDAIRFVNEQGASYVAVLPKEEKKARTKSIEDIEIHEHKLIGYDMYLEIIEQLKEVPGIEVFQTAVSYSGRKQYGIWVRPEMDGYISMTKYLTNRGSELINARHHANEVSSTNASFILLKKLLTEKKYEGLTDKLSLVLVPMENVDGAALHYELQKEHPYWKYHIARFDNLGREFFYDSFRYETIHTEALGHGRLFRKFLPDMIVDNHGVPSHEWEQQFSGYTSPSYKGFWLPRSLLYGYFWYVTDEQYHGNYLLNKKMEDVIADRIAEDQVMTDLNKEWSAQFEKYAHAWLPKMFPADYYKNMINYWIAYKTSPANRYPAARFPWITSVSYTSEVADETAQDEYLNLCARAHVAHDEATLEMLMQAEKSYDEKLECQNDKISVRHFRNRPMIIDGMV